MTPKTLTINDLKEGDILLYRGTKFFSFLIRGWEAIRYGNFKHFFISFSHIAQVVRDPETGELRCFDAKEGYLTGFRDSFGKAYVFRWIETPTEKHMFKWKEHVLSRKGSEYDLRGAFSNVNKKIGENLFKDYCSKFWINSWVAAMYIKYKKFMTPYGIYRQYRKKWDFIGITIK